MDYSAVIPYFVAVVALTAAPGPLMTVLVVRSVNRNTKGAVAFAAGLCAGDVFAVLAVALGIGVWAQTKPELLSLGKYLGVAYLLWIAVGMWNKRSELSSGDQGTENWLTSATAGIALCLGNPSTLLIYMLLLPIIAPTGFTNAGQMGIAALVTLTAVGMVFFGTILFAKKLSGLFGAPASSTLFARVTAGIMALTCVWIVAS